MFEEKVVLQTGYWVNDQTSSDIIATPVQKTANCNNFVFLFYPGGVVGQFGV